MRKLYLALLFSLFIPSISSAEGMFSIFVDSVDTYPFIVINKQYLTLYLIDSTGVVLRHYDVACAKNYGNKTEIGDNKTPEGIFKISHIIDSKDWKHDFGDGKGLITDAYGPFFFRWDVPNFNDIGLHGTHLPESIGTRATEGCVRMLNEDIYELKKLINVGTPIIVLPDPVIDTLYITDSYDISTNVDVFISYGQKDLEIAESIYHTLDSLGVSVFMARTGIEFGMEQPYVIAHMIENCKEYVFLRGIDTQYSPYAMSELGYAISRKSPEKIHIFSVGADESYMGNHSICIGLENASKLVIQELVLSQERDSIAHKPKRKVTMWIVLSLILAAGAFVLYTVFK
ncbi:MAG: L,D-transpeptidase family protein [Bacteroidaceae bacterium]|nr:L,D-transpeptidase family protein [Bacteroidaceae bacterium]